MLCGMHDVSRFGETVYSNRLAVVAADAKKFRSACALPQMARIARKATKNSIRWQRWVDRRLACGVLEKYQRNAQCSLLPILAGAGSMESPRVVCLRLRGQEMW